MDTQENLSNWAENVVVADADFIDKVAFDLTVNFERMIGRRIPRADMARWAECIALDGGLREGSHRVHVVLIHEKDHHQMDNFAPSDYESQLNGQAFQGPLGEFTLSAVPVEPLVSKEDLFCQTVQLVGSQAGVKRLMVIPDEAYYNKVAQTLRNIDDERCRSTVFAMQPMPGGHFSQEILGYSLMSALGIKAEELEQAE